MSKPRSKALDFTVYAVVRVLVCIIQALSLPQARSLAAGLAWLAYRLDWRHRLVARENLAHAFDDQFSEAEKSRLVASVYRHFCTVLVEIIHLPRKVHANNWRQFLDLRGGRQIVEGLLSGRPLLLVTGHFGNWELAGYALGLFGFRAHAIARPLDNPYLDEYFRRFRESTGQKVLAKKGDFDEIQAILDRGGVLATLADQDAGQRGLFVDFFNRPASTHKAVALLALEHRVPMLVIGAPRVGAPMRYEIVAEDFILPEQYEGRPDAVRSITQRFTAALERIIRTHPEQYFWLHRRWKHQPTKSRRRVA
jgi:Kdo2-lipid IVA lauroyltransferase/acyltransferase